MSERPNPHALLTWSRRTPLMCLVLLACSAGASDDPGGTSTGDTGPSTGDTETRILDVIRLTNDLILENYLLHCELCPCGAFQDVSADAEACAAEVIAEGSGIRDAFLDNAQCELASREREQECLRSVTVCSAATACFEVMAPCVLDADENAVADLNGMIQERCGSL